MKYGSNKDYFLKGKKMFSDAFSTLVIIPLPDDIVLN